MFFDPPEIIGTRSSSSVFTRSSGSWDTNALVGYYAFSCQSGQFFRGTWLEILQNTETTITVNGALDSIGNAVRISPWNPIAARYDFDCGVHNGNGRFWGGAIDPTRREFWPAPNGGDSFVRFKLANQQITSYAHGYEPIDLYPPEVASVIDSLFFGAHYDAAKDRIIYLPGTCPDIVIISPDNPENMIKIPHEQTYQIPERPNPNGYFNYWVPTETDLWLLAYAGRPGIVKFNMADDTITKYTLPAGYQEGGFGGGVYDPVENHLYIPSYLGYIIKINAQTGSIVKTIPNPFWRIPSVRPVSAPTIPQATYYGSGCMHGRKAIFPPYWGPILVLDVDTEKLRPIPVSGTALFVDVDTYSAAGQYLHCEVFEDWIVLFGQNCPVITFLRLENEELFNFQVGYGQSSFSGACYDALTKSFFTVPADDPYVFQIIPDLNKIRNGTYRLRGIKPAPVALGGLQAA